MRFEITFDGDSFDATMIASGDGTAEDAEASLQALLGDPRWRPGMNVLFDVTGIDTSSMTVQDIEEIAEVFARSDSKIGPGSWAIVTGSTAAYGLGRMWQALLESRCSLRPSIFSSIEEARGWRREAKSGETGA